MTDIIKAAGCAIINQNKELLLLYKINQDHFEFPGGKQEEGETTEQTATREAKEELGVDVENLELFHINSFIAKGKTIEGYIYTANIVGEKKPSIQEPEAFSDMKWIPIEQYKEFPLAQNAQDFCKEFLEKNN